ncbi:MAG: L,D-transpeptidase family protein [Agitococcus sp.]|nr:L,D-transpeptidase family protein [Agitococcus sp.]
MRFSSVMMSLAVILNSGTVIAASTITPSTEPFAHLAKGWWHGTVAVTVKKGDTLLSIGGRYATTPNDIATFNAIKPTSRLKIGQIINVKYAHLIPSDLPDGITINLPQRLLFLQKAGVNTGIYALGLGRPSWPTPIGAWTIANKKENKTWIVPKSIQEEMAREGKVVKTRVAPGANNPLGRYWLGLSLSGYGIHGTIAPASINRFQTHGCIRLHPEAIAELFTQVDTSTTGSNNYWPILLEIQTNGHIVIEVHPDIYLRHVNGRKALQQLTDAQNVTAKIDWTRADSALKAASGVPVDVTLLVAAPTPAKPL